MRILRDYKFTHAISFSKQMCAGLFSIIYLHSLLTYLWESFNLHCKLVNLKIYILGNVVTEFFLYKWNTNNNDFLTDFENSIFWNIDGLNINT